MKFTNRTKITIFEMSSHPRFKFYFLTFAYGGYRAHVISKVRERVLSKSMLSERVDFNILARALNFTDINTEATRHHARSLLDFHEFPTAVS